MPLPAVGSSGPPFDAVHGGPLLPLCSHRQVHAQPTQVRAVGRTSSRSATIACPHCSQTPYVPVLRRSRAASISASRVRASSSSAEACARSNASVWPSGSCSSSTATCVAASMISPTVADNVAISTSVSARSRANRASTCARPLSRVPASDPAMTRRYADGARSGHGHSTMQRSRLTLTRTRLPQSLIRTRPKLGSTGLAQPPGPMLPPQHQVAARLEALGVERGTAPRVPAPSRTFDPDASTDGPVT